MKTVNLKHLKLSDIAERVLKLEGEPYKLEDYPMFRYIMDSPYTSIVMKTGRQVSKTVTLGAKLACRALTVPYLPSIYTNCSRNQTVSFSISKLDPFLLHSPAVYKYLMNSKYVINNIFNKRFRNMSEVKLTYFLDSADRIRGFTGFHMYFDEIQDVLYDAYIDGLECASAAKNPKFVHAGTSKTVISTLEYLWEQSTMFEWIIKCEGCNKWNIPDIKNVGKKGIICKKCGKSLNTFSGRWYPTYDKSSGKKPMVAGFHVPQIIMPMHCRNSHKWDILLNKLDTYPDYKIRNEIFGEPIGEGDSPISEKLLRDACIPSLKMEDKINHKNKINSNFYVAGVDWGGGGVESNSRTVLSIYGVNIHKPEFVKLFGKIYGSGEPSKHVQDIAHYLRKFNAYTCYCDFGGGNFANSQLAEIVPGIRVIPVMYNDSNHPLKWDDTAKRFHVNRTIMIDSFILDIKKGIIKTFRWEDFQPFAKDILNIRQEVVGEERGKGKRVWRHHPNKPDDSLHSMLFGWIAGRVMCNMLTFTSTT